MNTHYRKRRLAACVTAAAMGLVTLGGSAQFGSVAGHPLPNGYTQFLQRGALNGARIGVDQRFFDDYADYGFPGDDDTLPFAQQALNAMAGLGATLVPTDTGDIFAYGGDEFTALLFEFKVHIADYLGGLAHTNIADAGRPDRVQPRALSRRNAVLRPGALRDRGIDERRSDRPRLSGGQGGSTVLGAFGHRQRASADDLDAIVAPHLTNATAPAVSGYPNLAQPVGITPAGKPAGLLMYSTFLQEPTLIALAYDLEQAMNVRRQPQFRGAVNDPPNAGLCTDAKTSHIFRGKAHLPHGRLFR